MRCCLSSGIVEWFWPTWLSMGTREIAEGSGVSEVSILEPLTGGKEWARAERGLRSSCLFGARLSKRGGLVCG